MNLHTSGCAEGKMGTESGDRKGDSVGEAGGCLGREIVGTEEIGRK